jgi:hypothetical protein
MSRGYVYLMTCAERFKIGFSAEPHARRTSLRNSTKLDLSLAALIVGGRSLERQVHHFFRANRLDGEWFTPSQDIADWFASHRYFVEPGIPYYPFPNGRKMPNLKRDLVIKFVGTAQRAKPDHWHGISTETKKVGDEQ